MLGIRGNLVPAGRYLTTTHAPAGTVVEGVLGDTIWTFETDSLDQTWVAAYAVSAGGRAGR
jgi:hypothetical protein